MGENSAIDRGAYSVSAKVYSEGTTLVSIEKTDFTSFLEKYPWLSMNLNSIFSQRLRDMYNKLVL